MIELEIDGKQLQAASGSNILELALKEGKYIPHFCYHKKLSIAANCRMCLVEVEKSPKPLPACATPVTQGMKVYTNSKLALDAQKGVMEFLLINHPLDCPICDQGGECQLQDLAIGYGKSQSQYTEAKRSVSNKDLGSLIATEMTRCIHCSRCVRFSDEIAGYQELGMSYRNNHVEVMPFIGKTVDSELSGNMIDICPVGALTSKPFHFKARSWELSRRKSISAFDSMGSNLILEIDKYHQVVRTLPLENNNLNECWLSDKDRFSYTGLYHEERITEPMIKQDNKWITVKWETVLSYLVKNIKDIITNDGYSSIGVLASPSSTCEELYLLQKLMRQLGIYNLDSRLNQIDFALDDMTINDNKTNNHIKLTAPYHFGVSLDELATKQSALLIGCTIREANPILAMKLRNYVKHGMQLNVINIIKEDLLCEVANQITCDPRELEYVLAGLVKLSSIHANSNSNFIFDKIEISSDIKQLFNDIVKQNTHIIIGDIIIGQKNYSNIYQLIHELANNINATYGVLPLFANEVGATLMGAIPNHGPYHQNITDQQIGQNTKQIIDLPKSLYILFNTELECDSYDSKRTIEAMSSAKSVVVMHSYINERMKVYADVIIPITPFTETAGSFINMFLQLQSFNGVTKALGNSRPAWKVLVTLAHLFNFNNYNYQSIDGIREEINKLSNANNINNTCNTATPIANKNNIDDNKIIINAPNTKQSLIRIGLQNLYANNSITRRAKCLQETKQVLNYTVRISSILANKLQLIDLDIVTVKQDNSNYIAAVHIDDTIPNSAVVVMLNNDTYGILCGRFDIIELIKKT